jgi:hypothetical protein
VGSIEVIRFREAFAGIRDHWNTRVAADHN